MIEPVPLTTAQKKVLGLKKTIGSKKQQQKKKQKRNEMREYRRIYNNSRNIRD